MYYYTTASTSEAAYIIGGAYVESTIAEFKNFAWRKLPPMLHPRTIHAAITIGDETMIIGGAVQYDSQ